MSNENKNEPSKSTLNLFAPAMWACLELIEMSLMKMEDRQLAHAIAETMKKIREADSKGDAK